MQQPPEEQRLEGIEDGPNKNSSNNNVNGTHSSLTPTRKTRRGKRGGRGRSLSPRTGVQGAAGGLDGRTPTHHAPSWFSSNTHTTERCPQMSHASPPPHVLPQSSFVMYQQQQHEDVIETRPAAIGACAADGVCAGTGTGAGAGAGACTGTGVAGATGATGATGGGPVNTASTAQIAASFPSSANWCHQDLYVDPRSTWVNTGHPGYQTRVAFGNSTSRMVHQTTGGGPRGGSGGGSSGIVRGPPQAIFPGHPARTGAGRPQTAEPSLALVGRVQNHLQEIARLFSACSNHGKSLSAMDMGKAEEQLRGASALMNELQRSLVEAHSQVHPTSQRVPAGTAPSTLPREDTYEIRHGSPTLQSGRTTPWNTRPETLDSCQHGQPGDGGNIVEPNAGVDEWQRGSLGRSRIGEIGGMEGGTGILRQVDVVNGENQVYPVGHTVETRLTDTGITIATDIASHPGSGASLQIEVGEDTISPHSGGSSTVICVMSSPDNDFETTGGEIGDVKKKKRRGKRGLRKGKKQMEGFAGFPLAPGLGPEFAGQPRRRLPKAPALEIMRGEHDLSAFCLQDDSSSQHESNSTGIITHTGESENLIRAGGEAQRNEEHSGGGDARGRFGVHEGWTAVCEGASGMVETGVARDERGADGQRGGQQDAKRHNGDEECGGAKDFQENDGCSPVCFEGRQQPASSRRQSRDLSGSERLANAAADVTYSSDIFEPNASGNPVRPSSVLLQQFPEHPPGNHDSDISSGARGGAAAGGIEDRRGGGGTAPTGTILRSITPGGIHGCTVGTSSAFFPETGDSSSGGGRAFHSGCAGDKSSTTGENTFPAPSTPSSATVFSAEKLGEGHRGMGNRRRSSGVCQEILTAGARASAEEAAREPSSAQQSSSSKRESEYTLPAEELRQQHGDGGGGGERGNLRLDPEEYPPPNHGSVRLSGRQQPWHQQHRHSLTCQNTGDMPTPLATSGDETPRLFATVAGVGSSISPNTVNGRFGSSPNHPTTPASTYSSPRNARRGAGEIDDSFRNGHLIGGVPSRLPDGSTSHSPPRHRATVADVQEAFERADTRFAKRQDQHRSGDGRNGAEDGCESGRPQTPGDASRSQLRDVVSGAAIEQVQKQAPNLIILPSCEEKEGELHSTLREPWIREADTSVENPAIPTLTPRCRSSTCSTVKITTKPPLTAMQLLQQRQQQLELKPPLQDQTKKQQCQFEQEQLRRVERVDKPTRSQGTLRGNQNIVEPVKAGASAAVEMSMCQQDGRIDPGAFVSEAIKVMLRTPSTRGK